MKSLIPYLVLAALSFAMGILEAINQQRNPGKSPAQRRAAREQYRRLDQ